MSISKDIIQTLNFPLKYYEFYADKLNQEPQPDRLGGLAFKLFFLINMTLFFIQLIFLAIGVAISVFFNKLKSVLPISLGVVFGFYMIGALRATGKNYAEENKIGSSVKLS